MIRHIFRKSFIITSVYAAPRADEVIKKQPKEPSWDRVYKIFTHDEFGAASPQLSTIYQTTFFSAFVGACYGGFLHSREAYLRFIERNEATKFSDHFEAKKNLQNFITVNFAKGAIKWSWRVALFSSFYITFVTILSAYYGDARVWHFAVGGLLSGGIYRVNLGLNGVIVGATLGLMIGLFAGLLTMTVLRLTGTTLDEVQEWQHSMQDTRQRNLGMAMEKHRTEAAGPLLKTHDLRIKETHDS